MSISDDFVIKYDARFMDTSRRSILLTPLVRVVAHVKVARPGLFPVAASLLRCLGDLTGNPFTVTADESIVDVDASLFIASWHEFTHRLSTTVNNRHIVVLGEHAPFACGIPNEVYELRTPTFAAKYSKRDWAVEDK